METKIGYAMQRILGRVDWYVTFSGVQNMRHTNFSQVLHVLNSFTVTQNDAWINLKLSKKPIWNLCNFNTGLDFEVLNQTWTPTKHQKNLKSFLLSRYQSELKWFKNIWLSFSRGCKSRKVFWTEQFLHSQSDPISIRSAYVIGDLPLFRGSMSFE